MKKRKVLSMLLLVIMLFTSISTVYALTPKATDSKKITSEDIKNHIIKSFSGFEIWKDGKAKKLDVIYDKKGNQIQNLHVIKNNKGTLGYVFTSIDNSQIIEFSLGESPFEGYLNKYFEKKKIDKEKIKDKIKLVKSNVVPSYTTDNFETFIQFTKDNTVNDYDTKGAVEAQSISTKGSGFTNQNIISGVPNYKNEGTMPACGPVSGMNLVGYWDNNGYSNLIEGESDQTIYNLLYYYMGSFYVGDGQHATSPYGPYGNGLEEFFSHNAYTLSVTSDFSISSSDFENVIKYEVDRDRPGTVLYDEEYNPNLDQYGQHYTTLVGYAYDYDDERYYIIHDLWHTYDIYRSWDADYSTDIWSLFKVRPQ